MAVVAVSPGAIEQGGQACAACSPRFATLTSAGLGSGIQENVWYRVTMVVIVTAANVSVTGKVFKHKIRTDLTSDVDGQVGTTLTFSGARPAGVDATGEVGIVASAASAAVDSSVANFAPAP